ncbi:hypothetical protein CDAR_28961 [Caerostris darwini]|uniref:Uncharacterized protein n=1 Tax=Caerostris darwini TaxID=1538125 RepID=A0AAV4N812_9ARAC|nr:hypothetical protein CDAR_28961 [Caerostris darwini]
MYFNKGKNLDDVTKNMATDTTDDYRMFWQTNNGMTKRICKISWKKLFFEETDNCCGVFADFCMLIG